MHFASHEPNPWLARCFATFATLQVAGFGLVSFLPGFLGVDGRTVTVPYRAIELAVGLLCIGAIFSQGIPWRLSGISSILAFIFWVSYGVRACYEALGHGWARTQYTPEAWELLTYLFLSTIPAFTVTYLMRDLRVYRAALTPILVVSIVSCLLSFVYHWDELTSAHAAARLGANDILSPIWYGHMGVTTALLSLFCLVRSRQIARLRIIALGGGVVLGVSVVLLSASRGPLIALAVLMPIVVVLASEGRRTRLLAWGVVLTIAITALLPILVQHLSLRGIALDHFFGSAEAFTESDSTTNHLILMSAGWQQFINHPLLGGGLFEPILITYPHNTIIEAFMATGLFGGTAHLLILGIATVKAFVLMRRRPEMAWLSVLFFQQLIHLEIAGCLYFSPTAFALTGAMLSARLPAATRSQTRRVARSTGEVVSDFIAQRKLSEIPCVE